MGKPKAPSARKKNAAKASGRQYASVEKLLKGEGLSRTAAAMVSASNNKHTEVTAASYLRMAKRHRGFARVHRRNANDKTLGSVTRAAHGVIGMVHNENAQVLQLEAARLRAQR